MVVMQVIRLSAMRGVPKDAANARTKQVGSDVNVYLPLWTRAACPSLCARRSHCPALRACVAVGQPGHASDRALPHGGMSSADFSERREVPEGHVAS